MEGKSKMLHERHTIIIGVEFGDEHYKDKSAAALKCGNCDCVIGSAMTNDSESINISLPKSCPHCSTSFIFIEGGFIH